MLPRRFAFALYARPCITMPRQPSGKSDLEERSRSVSGRIMSPDMLPPSVSPSIQQRLTQAFLSRPK